MASIASINCPHPNCGFGLAARTTVEDLTKLACWQHDNGWHDRSVKK